MDSNKTIEAQAFLKAARKMMQEATTACIGRKGHLDYFTDECMEIIAHIERVQRLLK